MILGAAEERLVVVSDLHLGSPASNADRAFPAFLDEVEAGGFALCVNGDGFDVLQSSTVALATTGFPILRRLHDLAAAGTRVYYVLGNHDHVLEHVLFDLPFTVMPFFNLRSGGRLIRIEHGHVHEPFYARHPGLYELGGRLGRLALLAHADAYQLWARAQQFVDDRRRRHGEATRYPHHLAAEALFQRGFDAAVFGHTHQPEVRELDGGTFVNGGDWLHHRTFVRVDAGELSLGEWEPGALVQGRTT